MIPAMRLYRATLVVFCLSAPMLHAQDEGCPPVADSETAKTEILRQLRLAPDETDARLLSDDLWRIWTEAPDARAQELLDEGMRQREGYDFLGARDTFDALVDYCPDYAEGYNQRAFASFLRQEYDQALIDLDAALQIDPRHVAALSGKALTLMGLGRQDEAQAILREALRLNRWLSERGLLTGPPETDI